MKSTVVRIVLIAGIAVLVLAGGYFLARKFLRDRESLMNFQTPRSERVVTQTTKNGVTTRTYTEKDLNEARKAGKLPPGVQQPYTPPSNAAGDAAVQRSLRTLEEINRINEMNRRLMEQQQRR